MSSPSFLFNVSNKNVLITGGSRGIGYMIAKGFSDAGANVLITSRSEKACEEAANKISCEFVSSNLSTRKGCEELASYTRNLFAGNRLHILINNAGCSWGEDMDKESGKRNWGWDKVLDLNVKSIFYLTRACIPFMESKKDDPGRVINIGSITGFKPQEAPTHAYDVSKAAVHHLTKKMAADLAPKNITVNCIAPGYVKTQMSDGLMTYGANLHDKITHKIPLQRMGRADDMTGACIFFSSQAGSWCTGVILNVDGGAIGATQIPLSSL